MNKAAAAFRLSRYPERSINSNYGQKATFILMLYFNVSEYQIRAFMFMMNKARISI